VELRERLTGALLGLALGERAGAGTAHTAMARNLLRSLAARRRFDPDEVMARHLEWFATRPPDLDPQTRRVLAMVDAGEPWREAARRSWEERGPEVSAGNGSVAYCAPLGIAFVGRPDEAAKAARILSTLTHWDERCRTACQAVVVTLAGLIDGFDAREAVEAAVEGVLGQLGGEELEFLIGAVGSSRRIDGPDRGFCLFAAAVGLQVVLQAQTFEAGVERVIELGGDIPANAAVAGTLLGARHGRDGAPADWLAALPDAREIEAEADALAEAFGL
jgi:ADP-ribosylglycohydrolase